MDANDKILARFCKRLVACDFDIFGVAKDETRWITVHPNGKENEGRPALIDSDTGTIVGGVGGKLNGKKVGSGKSGTKSKSSKTSTPLAKKNVQAIEHYVSGEGMYINDDLRNNTVRSEDKSYVKNLDDALTEPVPKTLYRNVDARVIFGSMSSLDFDNLVDAVVYNSNDKFSKAVLAKAKSSLGKTLTEKGFMSTTRNPEVAEEWYDFSGSDMPIVMKINTTDKTRGRNVSEASPWLHEKEQDVQQEETLLARNQQYKPTRIYGNNGVIYVDCDLI